MAKSKFIPPRPTGRSMGKARGSVEGRRKPTVLTKVASDSKETINGARELTGRANTSSDPKGPINEVRKPAGHAKNPSNPKGPVNGARELTGPAKAASNPKGPTSGASVEGFTNVDPPKQKLMLNMKTGRGRKGATTSSGREVKSTQDPQNATAEELDKFLDDTASSSPPRAPAVVAATHGTAIPVAANPQLYAFHHYPADIDDDVRELAGKLQNMDRLPIELPRIQDDVYPEVSKAWKAKQLVHLYILCYSKNDYNSCDLIADTWIRAFQKTNASPKTKIWKSNKASNYKPFTPHDYTDIIDPKLAEEVTDFDQDRLNELYFHTAKDCGARLLWADAMALGGDRLELKMEESEGIENKEWHKDIVWNVMRTSLRLVRVRLTLKIEERELGSWCDRYHEHGKQGEPGKPCYREVRRIQEEKDAMDASGHEHGGGGPVQSMSNGKRKAPEPDDANADGETDDVYDANPRKRVTFAYSSDEEDVSEEE